MATDDQNSTEGQITPGQTPGEKPASAPALPPEVQARLSSHEQAIGAVQPPAHETETAKSEEPIVLKLGNDNPHMQLDQGDGRVIATRAKHINQSVTTVEFEPGLHDENFVRHTLSTDNDRVLTLIAKSLPDEYKRFAVLISQVEQIMQVHAGGSKPTWVDGNHADAAKAVAAFYNCHLGQPQALLTNNGRDNLAACALSTSAPPATANYIALTANATAAAATDTTLTAEIATGGGGLVRAQATYAHTAGTNSSTLTKTFTANGSDALPVTLAKIGVFNASSVGTMVFETLLNATATLNVSGDNVTITETVNIG